MCKDTPGTWFALSPPHFLLEGGYLGQGFLSFQTF
jgi:hypothetical protein